MTIYVSELPKSCESCPFYLKDHCVIDNISFHCPLEEGTIKVLSIAEHDKQVRKEMCERLDKIIEKYLCKKGRYRESLDISSIIKQVMKENLAN